MLGQLVKVKNSQYFIGLTIPPLSNIGIVTRTHNSKNASPDVTVLIFYKPSINQIRFTEIPIYVKDLEILSTEAIMFEDVFKNKINLDDLLKKLDTINPFEAYQDKYDVDDLNDSNTVIDIEELRVELVKALMTIRIYKKIFNAVFTEENKETCRNEENNNPTPSVDVSYKRFRETVPTEYKASKRSPRIKPSDVLIEKVSDKLEEAKKFKLADGEPASIDNELIKEAINHFWLNSTSNTTNMKIDESA